MARNMAQEMNFDYIRNQNNNGRLNMRGAYPIQALGAGLLYNTFN